MTFRVEFSQKAKKDLNKLDQYTQKIIVLWLSKNVNGQENPRSQGKILIGDKNGLWRYRVGDYRIIVKIKDSEFIVLAIKIGHRREIYKK